ncbi:hypothetical protein M073_3132 [Bacteroides fragilis str. DS-71]|nr:hypothetical protein M073_3132 [Bacteroides fragilis str. DS-71]
MWIPGGVHPLRRSVSVRLFRIRCSLNAKCRLFYFSTIVPGRQKYYLFG